MKTPLRYVLALVLSVILVIYFWQPEVSTEAQPPNHTPTTSNYISALFVNAPKAYVGLGDGTIIVWDLKKREKQETFVAHQGSIRSIRATQDKESIISIGADGSIALWNRDFSLKSRRRFLNVHLNEGFLLEDGSFLVGGDRGHLRRTAPRPWRHSGVHRRAIFAMTLDHAREQLATVGSDNKVRFWAIEDGEPRGQMQLGEHWLYTAAMRDNSLWIGNGAGEIFQVELNPIAIARRTKIGAARIISSALANGAVAFGSQDGRLSILDLASGELLFNEVILEDPIYALRFVDNQLLIGSTGPTMRLMTNYDQRTLTYVREGEYLDE